MTTQTASCPVPTHDEFYDHACPTCRAAAAAKPQRATVISHSMELKITGTDRSPMVIVSVLELSHSNMRASPTAKIVSMRHFSRAEWDADALGCIADELTALIAPSLGVE